MPDIEKLQSGAAFVLRHKKEINNLLDFFRAEDIEKGLLCIPSELVNTQRGLAPHIMKKAAPYLRSFSVHFSGGYIFIDLELDAKQLGPVSAKYMITVDELRFDESAHSLLFTYKEDVKSTGSALQALALKAIQAKGPLLQTVAQKLDSQLLQISGDYGALWLDKIDAIQKRAAGIGLRYISAENEVLKLAFYPTGQGSASRPDSSTEAAPAKPADSPKEQTDAVSAEDTHTVSAAAAPESPAAHTKTARTKVQGGYLRNLLNYSDRF